MDGEIARFEEHLFSAQRSRGLDTASLITAERGLLKAFLYYVKERP